MKSQFARYRYRFMKVFQNHQAFVVILVVLCVLLAVLLRISTLSSLPLDKNRFNQESAKVKPVRFNEKAIEQIQSLSESNVADPGTQLPSNRQNPFNE